jgi:hypothetical protein
VIKIPNGKKSTFIAEILLQDEKESCFTLDPIA